MSSHHSCPFLLYLLFHHSGSFVCFEDVWRHGIDMDEIFPLSSCLLWMCDWTSQRESWLNRVDACGNLKPISRRPLFWDEAVLFSTRLDCCSLIDTAVWSTKLPDSKRCLSVSRRHSIPLCNLTLLLLRLLQKKIPVTSPYFSAYTKQLLSPHYLTKEGFLPLDCVMRRKIPFLKATDCALKVWSETFSCSYEDFVQFLTF